MGQITSLLASNELTGSASSSKSSQRSKKSRDATKVQKAEDVPLYKGSCSVDELVEYIHNGTDPTVAKSAIDAAVSPARCAVLLPTVSDRREQPLPSLVKHTVKKKIPPAAKKDPTESDSGCGDCITADHQKDLMNSVDVPSLGCAVVEDDIVALVTPAVVSLLNTVRSDVGVLYEGGSLADYDIETYTYDSLPSFVPSTEDEFMIVQRRRKGTRTTATPASNGVEIRTRRQLAKSSKCRTTGDDLKQSAVQSFSATSNDIVDAPVFSGSTIDTTPFSLESVSSYASANSSIRSSSPLELYSLEMTAPNAAPSSDDVSVATTHTSFSISVDELTLTRQLDHERDLACPDVFSPALTEDRVLDELSRTQDIFEMSDDQRLFESIRSTGTFCFFAAEQSAVGSVDDIASSSSDQTLLGKGTQQRVQIPPVSFVPTIQNMRGSPAAMSKVSGLIDEQLPLKHADSLPHKHFQRPWSGLDEFCSIEENLKLRSQHVYHGYGASCEFTFGSVDFMPYVCHSQVILPLTSSRCFEARKRRLGRVRRKTSTRCQQQSYCSRPVRFAVTVARVPEDDVVVRFGFHCDASASITPTLSLSSQIDVEIENFSGRRFHKNLQEPLPLTAGRVSVTERVKRTPKKRGGIQHANYSSSSLMSGSSRTKNQPDRIGRSVLSPDMSGVTDVSGRLPPTSLVRQSLFTIPGVGNGPEGHKVGRSISVQQSLISGHNVGHRNCERVLHCGNIHWSSRFSLSEAQNYFFTNYEITKKKKVPTATLR